MEGSSIEQRSMLYPIAEIVKDTGKRNTVQYCTVYCTEPYHSRLELVGFLGTERLSEP